MKKDLSAKRAKKDKEKRLAAKDAKEREGKTREFIFRVIAVSISDMEGQSRVWSCFSTQGFARKGQAASTTR